MDIKPPDNGNPYPEGAEPYNPGEPEEGQQIEVVAVEYADSTGYRGVGPIVQAIGTGIAASLIYDSGKWVISKAWDVATKQPVIDFTRPPTLYSAQTGLVYRLEGNSYVPIGSAQMR